MYFRYQVLQKISNYLSNSIIYYCYSNIPFYWTPYGSGLGIKNNDVMEFIVLSLSFFISMFIISRGLKQFWNKKNDIYKSISDNRLDELEGYNPKVFSELGGKEKVLDYL